MRALVTVAFFLLIQQITAGSIWPRPYILQQGSSVYSLNPSSFKFTLQSGQSDIIQTAFTRYQSLTFYTIDGHDQSNDDSEINASDALTGLTVELASFSEDLQVNVYRKKNTKHFPSLESTKATTLMSPPQL